MAEYPINKGIGRPVASKKQNFFHNKFLLFL